MHYRLTVSETEDAISIGSREDLRAAIEFAAAEAQAVDRLNIIFLEAENGNSLSLVVGSNETVLNFTYGHCDPPYMVSRGECDASDPPLTAFVALVHHTEYPRRWVIPFEEGMAALDQFVKTADLPNVVRWETT